MAHAKLTHTDAVKSWVLRACGWKLRDIQARFDVDPRRLYEVWEEIECPGSKEAAIKVFRRLLPNQPVKDRFEKHQPRFMRLQRQAGSEPMLPGF